MGKKLGIGRSKGEVERKGFEGEQSEADKRLRCHQQLIAEQ